VFWVAAFALILLPFLAQAARTPPGCLLLGELAGGQDYATYLAKIELGRRGEWAYRDLFTPEGTEPVPVYWFYLALGHLGRLTGLSAVWLFHLARAFFGAPALLAVWLLARREDPRTALLGVLAGTLGMSWLLVFLPRMVLPLGHVLGGLLAFPHYMADLLAWCGLVLGRELSGWRRVLLVAVSANLLAAVHPFLLVPACLLPVFRSLWAREPVGPSLGYSALAAGSALPLVAWVWLSFARAPWTAVWRAQSVRAGAWFAALPAAFGLVFWLAAWRLAGRWREDALWAGWVLSGWVSALAALAVRFPRNWWEMLFEASMPLGVLAARQAGGWRKPLLRAAVLGFACLLGFLVWASGAVGPVLCLPAPVREAFSVLGSEARGGVALVLPAEAGNLVPWLTGASVRPYVGHSCETLGFREKLGRVGEFLGGGPVPEGVGWVLELCGVPEDFCRAKEWPGVPRGAVSSRPDLELVWSGPGGRLWRVVPGHEKREKGGG